MPSQVPLVWRYLLAILSVIVALILMLGLHPFIHLTQASFLLFFGAVTLSALYGGQGPGIVATLLSALFANYFFLKPSYGWAIDFASGTRMLLFVLQGLLISVLVGALHKAQAQTRKSLMQLKATEAEIKDLNQTLQLRIDELQTLFEVSQQAERDREQAIADLRQSEERYRYLAESIPQLIWTASSDGTLLDLNQRWLDFTGLTLAQAQTQGWEAVVHPDDIAILGANWVSAQKEGRHYQAEGRMRRADGVYRWHLHQAIPFKNDQGQILKWFGTATDIEDKKRLEQERDQWLSQEKAARTAAEQANRIKDEFLAVLSHELRSPLNPILGWARLLRSRKLDAAKTAHALETIERNAKLQTQLIEDLLDVSRILRGKLSLHLAPIDPILTIEAALETVRLAAEAKSIQIHVAFDPETGLILGDQARLQQVIWNLLSNAVKFTPENGQVIIRLNRIDDFAQIQVSDTGQGIAADFLPHIFEYFRQADATTTRKFGGLGLGLAIVRQLVELHGGTVAAASPGESQGALFTVQIPLLRHPPQSWRGETTTSRSELPDPAPLRGAHILIVDDEEDSRQLIAFALETAGAIPIAAASATEAFQLFRQIQPDVIVSDIGMPEINGYMLIQQIRNLPADQGGQVPAIALTAYAGEHNQQQAIQAGFQHHLAKPVETDALIQLIRATLEEFADPQRTRCY